tara:strand:+ start:191 stop:520 length:330 start_codon:yes stop_codon:yes gene_type:complete
MSVTLKYDNGGRTGRPEGSGKGNYTKNPDTVYKGGRPRIIKSAERIEELKMKKREQVLKCYHRKRKLVLEKRADTKIKNEKIERILEDLRITLSNNDTLIEEYLTNIKN